jgi:hypothetical protein
MAQRGMKVTGLDLFPEAIAMARAVAGGKGVEVEFVCADLFSYSPERPLRRVRLRLLALADRRRSRSSASCVCAAWRRSSFARALTSRTS